MNKQRSGLVLAVSVLTVIGVLATPVAGIGLTDTDGLDDEQDTGLGDILTGGVTAGSGDDVDSTGDDESNGDDEPNGDDVESNGNDECDCDDDDDESDGDDDDSNGDDDESDDDDESPGDQDGSKDKGDDGDDSADQSNAQHNADDDPVDPNLLAGNSLTIGLGPENFTLETPEGDSQQKFDSDWDGESSGDSNQQSQQSNSDNDGLDLDALNGNSIAIGLGSEDVNGADGGDSGSQSNGADQYNDRNGDANQQSQQSNSDNDVLDGDLLNGNALAVALGGTNTSSGDGGDTDTQSNDNNQGTICEDGDVNQQSQQSNSNNDGIAAAIGNGNSGAIALGSDDTSAGDGGDTGTQFNDIWQSSGGCEGDTNQQNQQSNGNTNVVLASLLNGNAGALGLGGENTTASDGGDTNVQTNENSQKGNDETEPQHQAHDSDETVVPIVGGNGIEADGGDGTGDGGDNNEQNNFNNQFTEN